MAPTSSASAPPSNPAQLLVQHVLKLMAQQEGWVLEEDSAGGFELWEADEDTGHGFKVATARPTNSGSWILEAADCAVELRVLPRDQEG